jgi:hypothetical protein
MRDESRHYTAVTRSRAIDESRRYTPMTTSAPCHPTANDVGAQFIARPPLSTVTGLRSSNPCIRRGSPVGTRQSHLVKFPKACRRHRSSGAMNRANTRGGPQGIILSARDNLK